MENIIGEWILGYWTQSNPKIHSRCEYQKSKTDPNGAKLRGFWDDSLFIKSPQKQCMKEKKELREGFTKRYQIHRLVYFEFYETLSAAFARETAIKRWRRLWKIRLIEQVNPTWEDLYNTLF